MNATKADNEHKIGRRSAIRCVKRWINEVNNQIRWRNRLVRTCNEDMRYYNNELQAMQQLRQALVLERHLRQIAGARVNVLEETITDLEVRRDELMERVDELEMREGDRQQEDDQERAEREGLEERVRERESELEVEKAARERMVSQALDVAGGFERRVRDLTSS